MLVEERRTPFGLGEAEHGGLLIDLAAAAENGERRRRLHALQELRRLALDAGAKAPSS